MDHNNSFPPFQNEVYTGFVTGGTNGVSCPNECNLSTGAAIYNKNDRGESNIYDVNDIQEYYCVLSKGPPETWYTPVNYYRVQMEYQGFSTTLSSHDEVYAADSPVDFMFVRYLVPQSTCNEYDNGGSNPVPPTDPIVVPPVDPTPPPTDPPGDDPFEGHGGGIQKPGICLWQKTLNLFKL